MREGAWWWGDKTQQDSRGQSGGSVPAPAPFSSLQNEGGGGPRWTLRLLKALQCHHAGLSKAAHSGVCMFLGPYQNSTPCAPISDSRVFLPCSPGLHKPLPAHGPFSPPPVVGSVNLGAGHTHHQQLHAPGLLPTKRLTQQEQAGTRLQGRAGGGALESRLRPQARSLTRQGRTGPPRNPGAPSAVNTQSPENIRMESCQGPWPFEELNKV